MSVDIKQATLESLLSTYFFRTSAEAAARQLHTLITTNQRYTLNRLLRNHRLRGDGIMVGPESEGRVGTDRLLKCCSVLEIASQAGAIPSLQEHDWARQILPILGDSSMRRYYEDYYPERNPQLFLLRLEGIKLPGESTSDTSKWALFNRFLELDSRFVADLEEGPQKLFLQLLDDWSILYKGSGYRFEVIGETVANSKQFMEIITSPVVPEDPRSSGIHGFVAFLAFTIDLQSLLVDAGKHPLLQSSIWNHYGFWFDTLSDELGDKLSLALSHFLTWQPPENLNHETGESSEDARQRAITQVHEFVAQTKKVLLQLFSSDFRQPVEQALIATKHYSNPLSINKTLTGSGLLAKVKDLGDASKSDLVRATGYVSTKKDGSERLNFTAFYEALLEAKGVKLREGGGIGKGKGGRRLSYVATVQGNGNLLVGKAYTAMLDLRPGDEFEIKLGRKQIRLVPVGGADEEE